MKEDEADEPEAVKLVSSGLLWFTAFRDEQGEPFQTAFLNFLTSSESVHSRTHHIIFKGIFWS